MEGLGAKLLEKTSTGIYIVTDEVKTMEMVGIMHNILLIFDLRTNNIRDTATRVRKEL